MPGAPGAGMLPGQYNQHRGGNPNYRGGNRGGRGGQRGGQRGGHMPGQ